MKNKETVLARFPVARTFTYSYGTVEIHADSRQWPLPHMLGEGKTEEEAWAAAAENISTSKEWLESEIASLERASGNQY